MIIDPVKARGRKEIVTSCPYSAIYWNEEQQLAQKCTGCAHLLDDGWTETRCSHVCPTEAIKLVLAEDAEMVARVREEGLERYRDSLGTEPRVYYKNLQRWEKAFIACSAVFGDTDECAVGATLTVTLDGAVVGEASADVFGAVVVDELDQHKQYSATLTAPGYKTATTVVALGESLNLGEVVLEKA